MTANITAEQARNNAAHANFGTDEIVRAIAMTVDAVTKQGGRTSTHMVSRETASDAELQGAVEILTQRGFKVERLSTALAHVALQISW